MAHTQGPWLREDPSEMDMDTRPCILGGKNGNEPVCEILQPLTDEEGPYRGEYDARLIAAAPDLLSAAQSILFDLDSYVRRGGKLTDGEVHHVSLLRAAIDKAKGK